MTARLTKLIQDQGFALIDAHHHLWSLAEGHYPWLQDGYDGSTFMGDYHALRRDYLPIDFRNDVGSIPIAATVHVEAERDRGESVEETRWLDQLADRSGVPSVIVSYVNLLADDVAAQLDAHAAASARFRGVRCKPATSRTPQEKIGDAAGTLLDDAWSRGLVELQKRGLVWDLRAPWWCLADASRLIRLFPDLSVVLNHAGLPWDRSEHGLALWRDGMLKLAECPNVTVKLSEFAVPGQAWNAAEVQMIVRDIYRMFGADRCMFASNFPVAGLKVSYQRLVSTLAEGLDEFGTGVLNEVFYGTARRIYKIDDRDVEANR